jgi:ABC-type transport system substrate-binding protein|uniref:ABC transporter substrate-binding protein n=1 Tax=Prosthecobacter sp. TaxID=1965333 RepID=UPI00378404BB
MILTRTLILGFPLLVAALAWWAAAVSKRSHERPKDGLVVMLAQNAPALNPFLPATEAERQIADLVHEPLLRIDEHGALQPALADLWRWTQEVTCWFADAATAKQALERLQAQIGERNRWSEWHLDAAQAVENELRLSFTETAAAGAQQALEVIADLRPQLAAFWRIERETPLREAWDKFMATSSQAKQIRRVWFDGTNACEIVVAGSSQRLIDDLRASLDAGTAQRTSLTLRGEVGALVEPVLDLDIRPGQFWHDGKPVTAEDARATFEFLRVSDWPLPNRDALRHIQSLETQNDGARLHVTFRRRYGPALGAFADMPILPAAWLREHPQAREVDFLKQPPPGAGGHRIASRDARSLILMPVNRDKEAPRFLFSFAVSPLMTQIGMRTRTVDLVWPASAADHAQLTQLRFTPPRQRLVVLWNTRHDILKNPRFRAALAQATDIGELIRVVPGRLGHADASLFAPGLWFSTRAPRIPYGLEKARQILADEGWPRDVEGMARGVDREFRFTLLVPAKDVLHRRTAELLAQQWRKLGAVVALEYAPDASTLAQRLREHRFDAVLLDQRFEVSWDQLPWWHSAQASPGGTNFCGIADPQIDLQLEALATEFDPIRVPERVRALESQLLPLHPLLTLFTTHDEAATVPGLADETATENPTGAWTLRHLAMPTKHTPAKPVIDLKLRLPE